MVPVNQSRNFILIFVSVAIVSLCCKKKSPESIPTPIPKPSSDKIITRFSFNAANNPGYLIEEITGSIEADTIRITAPAGIEITNLIPTINHTGSSIKPASDIPQNFSSLVNYTVKAEDGSTKTYIVKINYRNTVFICSTGGVMYAFDGLTGQQIWKVDNGEFQSGTPSVYKGLVFICGLDGLYALNTETGLVKWKYPITATPTFPEFAPSPVTVKDIVFISTWDGFVYAVNVKDGTLKWKTQSTTGNAFSFERNNK
jgi:outer membrane protein assembly factor BamB